MTEAEQVPADGGYAFTAIVIPLVASVLGLAVVTALFDGGPGPLVAILAVAVVIVIGLVQGVVFGSGIVVTVVALPIVLIVALAAHLTR